MFIIPRNFWTSMISKNTLAISAITLVAVVLGMSALAPALANQVEPDGFQPPNGAPPISEECQECDDELNEELQEINEEFTECIEEAEGDSEEISECIEEANEDFQEAFDKWEECLEDNACFLRDVS